jgi:hypothetical protein
MTHTTDHHLDAWLDQASPAPEAPMATIHAAAMAAYPHQKSFLARWPARVGAIAATLVLGFGGFMAAQSYQNHQQALAADADAFAAALLEEELTY